MKWGKETIGEAVNEIVRNHLKEADIEYREDFQLDDLESIHYVKFIIEIEEKFDIEIDEELYFESELANEKNLTDYIFSLLNEKGE